MWDLDGAQPLPGHHGPARSDEPIGTLVPAPSGRYVSSWFGPDCAFYDVAAGRWTPVVGEDRNHYGVTWNSRGTRVATVGEGFVAIWDPATARSWTRPPLDGTYAAVDFSPDDTRIALLDDQGELSMLDAETLEPVGVPLSLGTSGGAVSLGPDGRALILTPGYVPDYTFDHASRQWVLADLDTGEVVDRGQLDFDAGWLASSPDGRHAAITGCGGELVVLDLDSGEPVGAADHGPRHHGLGHGRTRATARGSSRPGRDGGVSLWDGTTGELLGSVAAAREGHVRRRPSSRTARRS